MSNDLTIPSDLQYTKTHEWARIDDEGDVVIGITQHAVDLLGDLVFVELPEIGAEIGAGGEAGVVESVKAASDIYAPITGEVIAVNEALTTTPELLNSDPYGDGWIYKLRPDDESELSELLDSEAYAEVVAEDH